MKTDPNAPAYPGPTEKILMIDGPVIHYSYGFTKREAMAMHICAGICHDYGNVVMAKGEGISHVANLSVKIADALFAALNRDSKEAGDD